MKRPKTDSGVVSEKSNLFSWWGVGLVLVGMDQGTKWFFPTLSVNTGVSFGIPAFLPFFLQISLLSLLFCFLAAVTIRLFPRLGRWGQWGTAFFLAGAFSNILDRILWGGVRDWLSFPFFHFTNNLADIWITCGVVCILVSVWISQKP